MMGKDKKDKDVKDVIAGLPHERQCRIEERAAELIAEETKLHGLRKSQKHTKTKHD